MAPFDRPHFSFYWRFIVTMALVSFPKLSEIFVKNRDFSYLLHLMTPLGGGRLVWKKLEWRGYPIVEKVWWYVQPFRHNTDVWQTDGQTSDGQTSCDSRVRAKHTRHAVKVCYVSFSLISFFSVHSVDGCIHCLTAVVLAASSRCIRWVQSTAKVHKWFLQTELVWPWFLNNVFPPKSFRLSN